MSDNNELTRWEKVAKWRGYVAARLEDIVKEIDKENKERQKQIGAIYTKIDDIDKKITKMLIKATGLGSLAGLIAGIAVTLILNGIG